MSLKNTFRELAIANADKQRDIVDPILEEAPILGFTPMQETSAGLNHNFERLLSVTGPGVVDLDAELPQIGSETELDSVTLQLIGGLIEAGEDKLRTLGMTPGEYFANKIQPAIKYSAMSSEQAMLYNVLRAGAIQARTDAVLPEAADHALDAGGDATANKYSIIAVKWERDNCQGLYNPSGWSNGKMFDISPINGGNKYFLKESAGKVLGYGMRVKSDIGFLLANPRNVATIVNIDMSDADPANWKIPTRYQLDDVLAAIRANMGGNTMLLMHPKVKGALTAMKEEKVTLSLGDNNIDYTFDAWNGVPMITSYNFLQGAEAQVTF